MADGEVFNEFSKVFDMVKLSLSISPSSSSSTASSSANSTQGFSKLQETIEEEVDLSLGLSLGGRFGIDKSSTKKLVRSQAPPDGPPLGVVWVPFSGPSGTFTDCQSPCLAEWKKRKDLESQKITEAKPRKSDKQKNRRGNKTDKSNLPTKQRRKILKGDQPSSVQSENEVIQVSSGEQTQVSNPLPEASNQEGSSAAGLSRDAQGVSS